MGRRTKELKSLGDLLDTLTVGLELHPIGPANDPGAQLMGRLDMGGASFEVRCMAVTYDHERLPDGMISQTQHGVLDDDESPFSELNAALGGGIWETISLNHRAYAVVIAPYQR